MLTRYRSQISHLSAVSVNIILCGFSKKYMGESAMEYVRNVRLAKAAELFEQGAQSSLEVSLSCGFNNLSYFHREFKEKYGMTPGAFQRKINV